MKPLLLVVASGICTGVALAQDSAQGEGADSLLQETCAAEGVDLSVPESELSRSERRARRRCSQEAERLAADANTSQDDDDAGVICRRESVTGTHRRIRICTTAAEREAMREASRELIRDVTRPGGDFGTETQ